MKEYFVTKLSFRDDEKLIRDVFAFEYNGKTLSKGETRQRHWLVNRTIEGSKISVLKRNEKGKWSRGNQFNYKNNLFSWPETLPENITKRKTFVSFYHKDDQDYREKFENLFGDLVVSKSVDDGNIDSDTSDEYIKQLIQKDYLSDLTVLVVLIGANTKCRKHVDWEISGALNYKVGDNYAGLLGLFLPFHPNYGADKYTPDLIPQRLHTNVKSGYAILRDWTDDRVKLQQYIEKAFAKRNESDKIVNKAIPQMQENTCE
jgi:hypothetical protein